MYNGRQTKIDDEYTTPKYAWENIKQFIPINSIIWEPFYCDGKSGLYLEELGFKVVHKNEDFFDNDYGDIVISNPPFSLSKQILERLVKLNKPFILLMTTSKLNSQYLQRLLKDHLQLIIPEKRIKFNKENKNPTFDCLYYCWKMNLVKDLTFL